jgi:hypothetical protein
MEPLLLLVVQYLTWPYSHLRVGFLLPQSLVLIGFWNFYNIIEFYHMASPICMSNKGWHGILSYHGGQHDRSTCERHNFFIRAPMDTRSTSLEMSHILEQHELGVHKFWKLEPKKIHLMPQNDCKRFQTPIFQTGTCH